MYRGLSARIHRRDTRGNRYIGHGRSKYSRAHLIIRSSRDGRDTSAFRGPGVSGAGRTHARGMTCGQGDRRLFPLVFRVVPDKFPPAPGGGARADAISRCVAPQPARWAASQSTSRLEIEPHVDAPRRPSLDPPPSVITEHPRPVYPNSPELRLRSTVRRPDRIRDCSSIFNGQR